MDETPLFELLPVERAERYRQLAEEMQSRAISAATDETRLGYLDMAMGWLDMADRIQAEYGKVSVIVEAPALVSLLRRSSS
jgi:hypothetical protein